MFTLLVVAALAAAPAPRSASGSETVIHFPRLDNLSELSAFLNRAGNHAALLRPTPWSDELHPLLRLDVSQPQTLTQAGVDLKGPLTASSRPDGKLSCVRLAEPARFEEQARASLSRRGVLQAVTGAGGSKGTVANEAGVVRAGYYLRGAEACAFAGASSGEALRKEAVQLVATAPKPSPALSSLSGVLYLIRPDATLGIDAKGPQLFVQGFSTRLPIPSLRGKGPHPYANLSLPGLLQAPVSLSATGVKDAAEALRIELGRLCRRCTTRSLSTLVDAVAAQLKGPAFSYIQEVKVRGSLRTAEARFFAPRQAFVVEAKDAAALRTALAPLSQEAGAQSSADGFTWRVIGGTLYLRQQGTHLVVGNDEAVTRTLFAALPAAKAGTLEHGLRFQIDPRLVARGLSQISLLDLVASEELATLFAVNTEAGPLLAQSDRIDGWVDDAAPKGHRLSLTWTLPVAPSTR